MTLFVNPQIRNTFLFEISHLFWWLKEAEPGKSLIFALTDALENAFYRAPSQTAPKICKTKNSNFFGNSKIRNRVELSFLFYLTHSATHHVLHYIKPLSEVHKMLNSASFSNQTSLLNSKNKDFSFLDDRMDRVNENLNLSTMHLHTSCILGLLQTRPWQLCCD